MWELVSEGETVDNWKTLVTTVERPDTRTREDLGRLAEGISSYRSRGGQILAAKTMGQSPKDAFNYVVALFDEPAQQRCELDFVRISLGSANAVVVIYPARIGPDRDHLAKADQFLKANSVEVGRALASLVLPQLESIPR